LSGDALRAPKGNSDFNRYSILLGVRKDHSSKYVGNRASEIYVKQNEILPSDSNLRTVEEQFSIPTNQQPLICSPLNLNRSNGSIVGLGPSGSQYMTIVPSVYEVREEKRYGINDPYRSETILQKVHLPSYTANGVNSNDFAPICGSNQMNLQPACGALPNGSFNESCLRTGFSSNDPVPSANDMTLSLQVSITKPKNISKTRQYTPWGSEWITSPFPAIAAEGPSCEIFNDLTPTGVGKENIINSSFGNQGIQFLLGGEQFLHNVVPNKDSSLINGSLSYGTGGRWIEAGKETAFVTNVFNNTFDCSLPVNGLNPECSKSFPISIQSQEEPPLSIQGDSGENGTNGGKAILISSRAWNFSPVLSSSGGTAGSKGNTILSNRTMEARELTCYIDSEDPYRPFVNFIKFKTGKVEVREGSDGKPGLNGQSFKGWGASPEALEFLQQELAN
jgi:hypothetical protein